jgi:hypothetical protein
MGGQAKFTNYTVKLAKTLQLRRRAGAVDRQRRRDLGGAAHEGNSFAFGLKLEGIIYRRMCLRGEPPHGIVVGLEYHGMDVTVRR